MSELDNSPSRRHFLSRLAKTSVGLMVAGMAMHGDPLLAQSTGKVLATVTLANHPELASVGGSITLRNTPVGDILLVRSTEKSYTAINPVCPHKECKVKVKGAKHIECPCHKSSFGLNGEYKTGPAKKNLGIYSVNEKNGTLTITGS